MESEAVLRQYKQCVQTLLLNYRTHDGTLFSRLSSLLTKLSAEILGGILL